jgi:hypothetical protein
MERGLGWERGRERRGDGESAGDEMINAGVELHEWAGVDGG